MLLSQDQKGVGSLCLREKLQAATEWSELDRLGSHERQEKAYSGPVG